MNREDVEKAVLNAMINYDIEDIDNPFEEAKAIADYLIKRSGDNLTIAEINKCIHNRYDSI
jgi:hypothetical protein